jgi:glycosyltransferase involved in cell wall biosynthesis
MGLPSHLAEKDVFVIIPSYNEGSVVIDTVESLLPFGYSIVVVDDGSTDNSGRLLRSLPVYYLKHPFNLGQGAALQTGANFALRRNARYLVHFDADGQHPANRIASLLRPLRNGECDVVVGSRFLEPEDRLLVPWTRRVLLRGAVILSGLLTGVWLTDAHNGFRAFTRDAARKIHLTENGFAHATEFIEQVRRKGLRLLEAPVSIRYTAYSRAKGQSAISGVNILIDDLLRKVL